MKQKIMMLATGIVCLMASCSEDDEVIVNRIEPTPGEEVRFTSTLGDNSLTRTLYGADSEEATSIKVKWVHGDSILVYGVDCSVQQAEYKVSTLTVDETTGTSSVTSNTPHTDDGQDYATSLDKTGAAGVQWGDATTSDFYAVYPSGAGQFKTENGVVKYPTTIRANQDNVFAYDATNKVWRGTPYVDKTTNLGMPDAIMWAYTEQATNGDDVNLRFHPCTTVLKFRLEGWTDGTTNGSLDMDYLYVQSITLTAPSGTKIVGDFDLEFQKTEAEDGTATMTMGVSATPGTNASNTITVLTTQELGSYINLTKDDAIEFSVFTMPTTGVSLSADWTVTMVTTSGTFKYNLKPTNTSNSTTAALSPGKIHKVKIGKLPIENKSSLLNNINEWIKYIPRNVYLSELSLPGAWNATDGNYQATTDLATQYANGIRAFNIDCRMSPSSYDAGILGLGASYGPLQLVCAGTDKWSTGGTVLGSLTPGTTVLAALQNIAKQIKDEEYVVVVLTIAEKPLTSSGTAHGGATVDPVKVIPAIKEMINTNGQSLKIFGYTTGTQGKTINSNTLVKDVLGHMIVKINSNTNSLSYYEFPTGALVSFASMASNTDYNTASDSITDLGTQYFSKMQTAPMRWGNENTDLTYYYHQAQLTLNDQTNTTESGTPTFKDRMNAVDDIIANSKTIYDNNLHNGWFQIGIGGYIKPSNTEDRITVAQVMNNYVKEKIEEKINSDPSPVGIVLMNYCTNPEGADYYGPSLVQDIVTMNEKFYLNRDETQPEWPDGTTPADAVLLMDGDGNVF